jgi:hypothetical protein
MVGFCFVATLSFFGLSGGMAPAPQTLLQVEVRKSDETLSGRVGVREEKLDEDLLTTPRVFMAFLSRRDVKDQKGRIVSGIGAVAWAEGEGARVWVFSVVPKDDVPNDFYASPQGIVNTKREPLAEFVLKVGETRRLVEMEPWGVEAYVLELIRRR